MSVENSFRRSCHRIVQTAVFDIAIILLIIFSTALATIESPLADPKSAEIKFYETANTAFTYIFLVEALIKIVAYGFVMNGKTSYLRKTWN